MVVIIIIIRSHLGSSVRVVCEGRLLTNDVLGFTNRDVDCNMVLVCCFEDMRFIADELSAARNDTLARRSSGGAAPRLGPPMLLPARGEHVANVFMVRSLAWLCSGGCGSNRDVYTWDARSARQHCGIVPCFQHARHAGVG